MEPTNHRPSTEYRIDTRLEHLSAQVTKRNTLLKTLALVFLLIGGLTTLAAVLLGKDKSYQLLGFAQTFEDY